VIPTVAGSNGSTIDANELAQAQAAVAMSSPQKLCEWLERSDRTYLVLHAPTLVRALPWPQGPEWLVTAIDAYTRDRRQEETGWVAPGIQSKPNAPAGEGPVYKDDRLFLDEIDAAIAQLSRLRESVETDLAKKGARRV